MLEGYIHAKNTQPKTPLVVYTTRIGRHERLISLHRDEALTREQRVSGYDDTPEFAGKSCFIEHSVARA